MFDGARPRPVHIEIPLDVIVEEAGHLLNSEPVRVDRAAAAPATAAKMAALLAGARRPLILAGGGAIDASAALTRLAEYLQAPTALTINAKGMLPSSHPLLIGSTQTLVATRELVCEADVILAIGTELAETDYDVTFKGGFEIPGTLLRIDIDPDQTVRNYPPKLALVADANYACDALLHALAEQPSPVRAGDWGPARAARLRETLAAQWDDAATAQTLFLDTILEALPNAAQLVAPDRLRHPRLRPAGGHGRLAGQRSAVGMPDWGWRYPVHPAGTGQCRGSAGAADRPAVEQPGLRRDQALHGQPRYRAGGRGYPHAGLRHHRQGLWDAVSCFFGFTE